ncbi:Acetyltransferase [Methanosarcina siciliae T4/M]|uniref:Acetyltransferase n=2 Tax=Methanosarcina siciliae TaxID=38027 RepID=A0A0E3PHG4_9EURY|nr:N-acetyltransferase [Methanosarcina siciliae]AKB30017.1 Acetyltransferase [Methanosarcina siciliae T4/M]AKB33917.1 Acetyltransferase [Methanosarcina siciliae HI350]
MELKYVVRGGETSDLHKIVVLYRTVASRSGGIAREADEVTEAYVRSFIEKSLESGIILAIEDPENPEILIAEVHTYKPGIKVFAHIFSDLTIVVRPDYQGKGIGKLLLGTLLQETISKHSEVMRVELLVRESNKRAIEFYKKLGFNIEGRLENRICDKTGKLEADIPMGWTFPACRQQV